MRKTTTTKMAFLWAALSFIALQFTSFAQVTGVGNGSYTTTFPGTDAAGRNSYPSGTPQLSENALGSPVPTNDWWSTLIQSDHASNLFNYPLAMKTTNDGLVMSYISWGVFDDLLPIVVGVDGLNASKTTIADHSDWTVTMDWNDASHHFQATSGIGMPFVYFNKSTDDLAQVTVNHGTVTVAEEVLIIENAREGADFVVYAPSGSEWTLEGTTYSSTLNGENYWSMVMLPLTTSDVSAEATNYQKYAYVFPVNTTANWDFNEASSVLTTTFSVETDIKEGNSEDMLIGLLPHQWANLSSTSTQPSIINYSTVRGELKMIEGTSFVVENTFHGILPTLPYLSNYSDGFDVSALNDKVTALENEGLASWTDSYNEGQAMNRLIQTARIADLSGNTETRDKLVATIKERLEDWLTAEEGEVAFLFYYNEDWSALLGYPAGHGQDSNLNDHHFHWGYFIHAAAFMEQYEPGWADQYGDMINLLVRDASSPNRDDDTFPYLRSFSPYAGHCWANGFASFPQGNDQESTSESMQFHSALIHWGTVTGNDEIRDLGIYLYTTEQTAVEEYWFDVNERNFKDDQPYSVVSRVWGNSYDNGTFWTADIAASYNIELYPIHGGALYLGHNTQYVEKLWNEISENTDVLNKIDNPNLWYDVMWSYLSFTDPAKAIDLYNDYPERAMKFGVADAQTYYWLHNMNAMGKVDATITADYPMGVAFNKEGEMTYVAHNYGDTEISVSFSDGYELTVPANSTATNRDVDIEGTLVSSFNQAAVNGAVDLTVTVDGTSPTKVEFFDKGELLGEVTSSPYTFKAENLAAGEHQFYTKIYNEDVFGVSNIVSVIVGLQVPFGGESTVIPGTLEAGNFDTFEGGLGQGVTYSDQSAFNEGNFREEEYVDNVYDETEGATVGWTAAGEWMEYTVEVETSGLYTVSFRYASDNATGGPFSISSDGEVVADDISVTSTGGWGTWATGVVENVPLSAGKHILRVAFSDGGFNLGRLTFELSGDLPYSQPVADAGDNLIINLSGDDTILDASNSTDPDNGTLTFEWSQVYGPSVIEFSDASSAMPTIYALVEGTYLVELTVNNGEYTSTDELLLVATTDGTIAPSVSLTAPMDQASFYINKDITLSATATDLDGTIAQVEFFVDDESVGTVTEAPFNVVWVASEAKEYTIHAVATDNDGKSTTAPSVRIVTEDAPPCRGTSENGDYDFEFSDAAENPTLTFHPNQEGMGSPVCILYLSVNGGGYGGYSATAGDPFQVNAANGSTISFYYTYTHPAGGERNTSANPNQYIVGSCENIVVDTSIPTVEITSPENGEFIKEGTALTITASANDGDGTVAQVEFFANGNSIGVVTETPYEVEWTLLKGQVVLTAQATDNDGKIGTSTEINIVGTSASACYEGVAANGDFAYLFSEDLENPTLTLQPQISGAGSSVLILYYSVDGVDKGGHNVTPNEPFQLTAAEGSTITFYYTYSHPEGGERNTIEDIKSFEVGSCNDDNEDDNVDPEPNELTVSIQAPVDGSVLIYGKEVAITVNTSTENDAIKQVEFFANDVSLGIETTAPYTLLWSANVNGTVALKVVISDVNDNTATSEVVNLTLGEVTPYGGTSSAIPGVIEAANYDVFELGNGQGVTYFDTSENNEGNYRAEEFVDAVLGDEEGATIGWVAPGEWLRYSVDVATKGLYSFEFRYASDNQVSRGPFYLEVDGNKVTGDIEVSTTAGWNSWESKTVSDIELSAGEHVLRVVFIGGEFNLGKMTFTLDEEIVNLSPSIALTTTATTFEVGTSIYLNVDATDTDGTIVKVEYFIDEVSMGSFDTAPYVLSWLADAVGTFEITAVATDNEGGTSESSVTIEITTIADDTDDDSDSDDDTDNPDDSDDDDVDNDNGEVTAIDTNEVIISYYPNPVTHSLTIDLPELNQKVVVFNLDGKVIGTFELGQGKSVIDMSMYQSGIYFINIQNDQYTKQLKVVKQ
ncbi:carbohydrate-binding protein [Flammeovirga pectinis]|uniref:glucan endo-1,3-beta-D-glucosidase n=1 Tax=Flammeovirga pectinis TaxID=2494373 RepID=A0A3Q9FT60_9BACT|nr:Ig-like domain-containing protein [Flammeovirga pectinis]AZQ64061.1 carbohydrate-binding protein [Flammeovirga pectinis]